MKSCGNPKVLANHTQQYIKRIIHLDQAYLLQEFQEWKDGLNIKKNKSVNVIHNIHIDSYWIKTN